MIVYNPNKGIIRTLGFVNKCMLSVNTRKQECQPDTKYARRSGMKLLIRVSDKWQQDIILKGFKNRK